MISHLKGEAGIGELAAPHNEHRLLLPRLFWIALFELNGRQWDPVVTQFAGAVISAAAAMACLFFFAQAGGWLYLRQTAFLVIALFALPITWMNLVWGFQAQFHFQIALSIIALGGLGLRSPGSPLWWLGAACGLLSLFTSASGALFSGALLVVFGLRLWREGRLRKSDLICAAYLVGLILLAVVLMPGGTGSDRLRAQGLSDFFRSVASHFSWPWKDAWPLAALIYAPAGALFTSLLLDRRGVRRPDAEFALMLAGTAAIQIFAMAFARGADGAGPHPRYADIHLLGVLANAFCLFALSRMPPMQRTPALVSGVLHLIKAPLSLAWTLATGSGLIFLAVNAISTHLPQRKASLQVMERNVRLFVRNGDESHLRGKFRGEIPAEEPQIIIDTLREEIFLAHLPPAILSAASLVPERATGTFSGAPQLPENLSGGRESGTFASCYSEEGGTGDFLSAPMRIDHPFMTFSYAGFGTQKSLRLGIRMEGSDVVRWISIADNKAEGRVWRDILMPSPAGFFVSWRKTGGPEAGSPLPDPSDSVRSPRCCARKETFCSLPSRFWSLRPWHRRRIAADRHRLARRS